VWVLNEYAVHGKETTLIFPSRMLVGSERGVAATDEEAFIAFKVSKT
jgi:hypothetical protein